ncbi:CGNR zinc finger domain-containing protein [Streptomyces sp. BH106]|uniref:CGNR zinc finger domain-containing protein n=1 Tax=Streptomyces sp. BH106 TaxID=3410409 RepID=UPI003CF2584C
MRGMEEFVSEEDALPDALPPAPGEAEHAALALANSAVALPGGHTADLLGTPARAEQWLMRRDLAPADTGMAETCATQLRSLREQIRSLLASRVAGHPALPAAVAAINDAMTRVPTASLLGWDEKTGPYRAAPHPTTAIVEHALAVIAADAADLLTSPDADRLAACASPPCNRFVLKHGRRQWCSTRCGDRARAARAYARRSHAPTE